MFGRYENPAFAIPACKLGDARVRPDGLIQILESCGPDHESVWVVVDDWAAVAAWHAEMAAEVFPNCRAAR